MPKQYYFLILIIICVFSFNFGAYFAAEKHDPKTMPKQSFESTLYVTSPMEEHVLESSKELWPRLFSEENLLQARDVPELYSKALPLRREMQLRHMELTNARRWSVLLNTKHYAPLRDDLYGKGKDFVPKSFEQALNIIPGLSGFERCHLFMQERAFRIAQIESKLRAEAVNYFKKCGVTNSPAALWLEIYPLFASGKSKELTPFFSQLQKMATDPALNYKRVQAGNMLKVLELASNHAQ